MIITGISYAKKSGGAEKALLFLLQHLASNSVSYFYEYSSGKLYKVRDTSIEFLRETSPRNVDNLSDKIVIFDLKLGVIWSYRFYFSNSNKIVSERAFPTRFSSSYRMLMSLMMMFSRAKFVFQTKEARKLYLLPFRKAEIIENYILSQGRQYNLAVRDIDILIPGRICFEKGWSQAPVFFEFLNKLNISLRIVVLGDGDISEFVDLKYYSNLDIVVTPYSENIDGFYSRCKVVVLFSNLEGYPNVILEGMFFGAAICCLKSNNILSRLLPDDNLCLDNWSQLSNITFLELLESCFRVGYGNYLTMVSRSNSAILKRWEVVIA